MHLWIALSYKIRIRKEKYSSNYNFFYKKQYGWKDDTKGRWDIPAKPKGCKEDSHLDMNKIIITKRFRERTPDGGKELDWVPQVVLATVPLFENPLISLRPQLPNKNSDNIEPKSTISIFEKSPKNQLPDNFINILRPHQLYLPKATYIDITTSSCELRTNIWSSISQLFY